VAGEGPEVRSGPIRAVWEPTQRLLHGATLSAAARLTEAGIHNLMLSQPRQARASPDCLDNFPWVPRLKFTENRKVGASFQKTVLPVVREGNLR